MDAWMLRGIAANTNLVCAAHLVLPQDFNTRPQSHQGLVDVTCKAPSCNNAAYIIIMPPPPQNGVACWFGRNVTGFAETVAIGPGPASALAARQVHQAQLAHRHLALILDRDRDR